MTLTPLQDGPAPFNPPIVPAVLRLRQVPIGDRPSLGDYMIGDQREHWLSEVFNTMAEFRSFFGVPEDHPLLGSGKPYAQRGTSGVPLNSAMLTGCMYLFRGLTMSLPPGTYDMGDMPVLFVPPASSDRAAIGELGPRIEGSHPTEAVLDWSRMGPTATFLGPWTGATFAKQAALLDIASVDGPIVGKRGVVSRVLLRGFTIVGPRSDDAYLDSDLRWISGLRITCESSEIDNVRVLRVPDIGIYIARSRYTVGTDDDRGCFITVSNCLINSCGRIGICIGARVQSNVPTGDNYSGAPDAQGVRGYFCEHVVTRFNDILKASGLVGFQVWAEGWEDVGSLATAAMIGIRLIGLRSSFPCTGVMNGTRAEAAPKLAAISLDGAVELDLFGILVAAGALRRLPGAQGRRPWDVPGHGRPYRGHRYAD